MTASRLRVLIWQLKPFGFVKNKYAVLLKYLLSLIEVDGAEVNFKMKSFEH